MSTTTAMLLVLKIKLQQRHVGHYCLGYLDEYTNYILSFYCYSISPYRMVILH